MSEITTAVILCGGQGTRLRPITYEIPKPLIPVHGKAVVEHIFDLLKRHGITEVVLSVGYLKERIRDHFGDGSRCGMRISYLEEREPLGTAGPIRLLKEQGLLPSGPFVVSNGDELKDIDIDAMLAVHKRVGALATDALTPVSDPSLYGIARLEGDLIRAFVEKPAKGTEPSNLANAGFYILEPAVAELIPAGFAQLELAVFPKLAAEGRLAGFPFAGQWFDTGNFERYERAIKEWKGLS